jgi:hypothetical protein
VSQSPAAPTDSHAWFVVNANVIAPVPNPNAQGLRRTLICDNFGRPLGWPKPAVDYTLLALVATPHGDEHYLRRALHTLQAVGLAIDAHDRFKLGIVERLAARKRA